MPSVAGPDAPRPGVDNPEYFQMCPEGVEQKNANTILPSSSTATDGSIPFHPHHNLGNNRESQHQSNNNNNDNDSSSISSNNFLSIVNRGSEFHAATGAGNVFVNDTNGSGRSRENLIDSSSGCVGSGSRSYNTHCVGSDCINVNANNTLKSEGGIDIDEVLPPLPPRSYSQLSPSSPCGASSFTYGNTGSSYHGSSPGSLSYGNTSDSLGLNLDSSNSLQWPHLHPFAGGHPSRPEESPIKAPPRPTGAPSYLGEYIYAEPSKMTSSLRQSPAIGGVTAVHNAFYHVLDPIRDSSAQPVPSTATSVARAAPALPLKGLTLLPPAVGPKSPSSSSPQSSYSPQPQSPYSPSSPPPVPPHKPSLHSPNFATSSFRPGQPVVVSSQMSSSPTSPPQSSTYTSTNNSPSFNTAGGPLNVRNRSAAGDGNCVATGSGDTNAFFSSSRTLPRNHRSVTNGGNFTLGDVSSSPSYYNSDNISSGNNYNNSLMSRSFHGAVSFDEASSSAFLNGSFSEGSYTCGGLDSSNAMGSPTERAGLPSSGVGLGGGGGSFTEADRSRGGAVQKTSSTFARCSLEDLRTSELRKQQAVSARKAEQANHEAEKLRLDEIVQLCAEYQRQHSSSPPLEGHAPPPNSPGYGGAAGYSYEGVTSPAGYSGGRGGGGGSGYPPPLSPQSTMMQNRIKTNGSLPRDKRSPPARDGVTAAGSTTSPEAPPKPPRSPRIQRAVLGRRVPPPPPVASHPPLLDITDSKPNSNNNSDAVTADLSPSFSSTSANLPSAGKARRRDPPPPVPPNKPSLYGSPPKKITAVSPPARLTVGSYPPPSGGALSNDNSTVNSCQFDQAGRLNRRQFDDEMSGDLDRFEGVGVDGRNLIGDDCNDRGTIVGKMENDDYTQNIKSNGLTVQQHQHQQQSQHESHQYQQQSHHESHRYQHQQQSHQHQQQVHHEYMNSSSLESPHYQNDVTDTQFMDSSPATDSSYANDKPGSNGPVSSEHVTSLTNTFGLMNTFGLSNTMGMTHPTSGLVRTALDLTSTSGLTSCDSPSECEELLRAERNEALQYTTDLKRSVADLARQEEEHYRELEVERALLEAECGDVEAEVERLEAGLLQLTERSTSMEDRHTSDRQYDEQDLQACEVRVTLAEAALARAEKEEDTFTGDTDAETRLLEDIKRGHELLDAERKVFEDTEFNQLEREAQREAEREDLNRLMSKERARLSQQEERLAQLRRQVEALSASVQRETDRMDAKRASINTRLQQERNRAKVAEQKLLQLSGLTTSFSSGYSNTFDSCTAPPPPHHHTYANTGLARDGAWSPPSPSASSDTEDDSSGCDRADAASRGSRLHLLCDALSAMTHSVTSLAEVKGGVGGAGVASDSGATSSEDRRERRLSLGEERAAGGFKREARDEKTRTLDSETMLVARTFREVEQQQVRALEDEQEVRETDFGYKQEEGGEGEMEKHSGYLATRCGDGLESDGWRVGMTTEEAGKAREHTSESRADATLNKPDTQVVRRSGTVSIDRPSNLNDLNTWRDKEYLAQSDDTLTTTPTRYQGLEIPSAGEDRYYKSGDIPTSPVASLGGLSPTTTFLGREAFVSYDEPEDEAPPSSPGVSGQEGRSVGAVEFHSFPSVESKDSSVVSSSSANHRQQPSAERLDSSDALQQGNSMTSSTHSAVTLREREAGAEERRPLSEASSCCGGDGVRYRDRGGRAKQQRPLTRYLPVKSSEPASLQFSLRQHIESAGHQIELCPSLILTATSCRGYLHKMTGSSGSSSSSSSDSRSSSQRLFGRRTFNKRWFVFDRNERALIYYPDKSEAKARGCIDFEDIEEVYVDHLNPFNSSGSRRSGGQQPAVAFCVKSRDRTLSLLAATPSAMRIWVEVIFTGAEGYNSYDHSQQLQELDGF